MTTFKIWYQLKDSNNNPFKEAGVASVRLATGSDVDDLRKKIRKENASDLKDVDGRHLVVKKNNVAQAADAPVEENKKETALDIVVPSGKLGSLIS
jgi:hypothetical protein